MTVPTDSFAINAESFAGQEIRLREIPVSSRLGSQMFWTQLPGQQGMMQPYLLALDSALAADSVTVEPGETVTVVGQVHPVTDSVLNGWVQTGVIEEGQRLEAEFATSFMRVSGVRRAPGGDAGSPE